MKIREIGEINADIAETQKKLDIIEKDITKKGADIERMMEGNAALIEKNIGNVKPSKAIATQQSFLQHAVTAREGMERARSNLISKLETLQQELKFALTYEEISHYPEQERIFFEQAEAVEAAIDALNEQCAAFEAIAGEFMETQPPVFILQRLAGARELQGLSLIDFLQGELRQAEPGENDRFMADTATSFSSMANRLSAIKDVTKPWQNVQSKLLWLSALATSLVPRSHKFVETPPEPKRATPIEKPPAEFAEINGKPFRWDEELQRYMPTRTLKRDPGWGLISNA